jgi:nicotinate-nucleotide adenylyltransferase
MNKIALFGTSADPPTIAHIEIINWLATQFDIVAIWAADNPFKTHGATLEQRAQMLERSIAEIDPNLQQHTQVYRQLSHQFTFETVQIARSIWGHQAEYTLTIGADLITQLPKWYRIEELLAGIKIIIIPRHGSKIEPADLKTLERLGAHLTIAPLETPPISSTEIRNQTTDRGLTPRVASYINHHHLYSH